MTALTGLNTGLLIRAQHEVRWGQGKSVPDALVEVQDTSRLFQKGSIPRKDPTAETPGTESILAQPTPKGRPTDFRHQSFGEHFTADLGQREARQGEASTIRKFTGQGFNLNDQAGGKSGQDARREVPLPGRAIAPNRNACAIC